MTFPHETAMRDALRQVIDPELDCNIVDLGLVYKLERRGSIVRVEMTLTTSGCPMHETIVYGVQMALLALPGVDDVLVELVWDPPWDPSLMTPAGRAATGIRG